MAVKPKRWAKTTELVSVVFELEPQDFCSLYPQYAIGLHAWFLDQVRQSNPELSAYLHDGGSEKAFTISRLMGLDLGRRGMMQLEPGQRYGWQVTALSRQVVQWLEEWLASAPEVIALRGAPLNVVGWELAEKGTTYSALWRQAGKLSQQQSIPGLTLSFVSPTSFRRKKQHFPLPLPTNVLQSYLRRWNDFSGKVYESDTFLEWVDESVVIRRHRIESCKVAGGKRGVVTGFMGAVEFGLTNRAVEQSEYVQLFFALGGLAPYCGTGHKTTFGLGQTVAGWHDDDIGVEPLQAVLAGRIEELTVLFEGQRQRRGGTRARHVAETWATILARRELGESLMGIAEDLGMRYETVKTYVKLARQAVKGG